MKQVLTKGDALKAMNTLTEQGKNATLASHAVLGHHGSLSTVVRLKDEIEAEARRSDDSPEALEAFRNIWAAAVEQGRKQQEAHVCELRDNIMEIAADNERPEAATSGAQAQILALEKDKDRLQAELHQIQARAGQQANTAHSAMASPSAEASAALRQVADRQCNHAREISSLRQDLEAALERAPDIELQLIRAQAPLTSERPN